MDKGQLIKKRIGLCQKGQFQQSVDYFRVVIDKALNKNETYLWLAESFVGLGISNMAKSVVYQKSPYWSPQIKKFQKP